MFKMNIYNKLDQRFLIPTLVIIVIGKMVLSFSVKALFFTLHTILKLFFLSFVLGATSKMASS